jgi:hypothetical protein
LIDWANNDSMGDLTSWLDREFLRLRSDWRKIIETIEPEKLYQRPSTRELSCGEYLIRSASVVEQTFGGITANLWDDPFEWTLPENLTTPERVLAYLDDVEATRRRGFESLKNDEDLVKRLMAPSGITQLGSLLLDTIARARFELHRAKEIQKQI